MIVLNLKEEVVIKYQLGFKTMSNVSPGGRSHGLGDLVTYGSVVPSHVHRSSLVGRRMVNKCVILAFKRIA